MKVTPSVACAQPTYTIPSVVCHAITGDLTSEHISDARFEISRGVQAALTALSEALREKNSLLDNQAAADVACLCSALLETLEIITEIANQE